MTEQETFDKVVAHLRKQGMKAEDGEVGICMYRTSTGLKCAVGCLIPDDRYSPSFEGFSIRASSGLQSMMKELGYDTNLLEALQRVHDGRSVPYWEEGFAKVAADFNLTYMLTEGEAS